MQIQERLDDNITADVLQRN